MGSAGDISCPCWGLEGQRWERANGAPAPSPWSWEAAHLGESKTGRDGSAGLMQIPGGSGMKGILAAVFQQEIKEHWLLALGVQGARGGAVRAGRQGEQTPKSCGLQENCPSVLEALLHLTPPALPLPTTAPAVALVDVADATPWCSSTGLCRGLRARSNPCFSPQPHQMSCW